MHGLLHVRIRGGPGRVTARVYPTPICCLLSPIPRRAALFTVKNAGRIHCSLYAVAVWSDRVIYDLAGSLRTDR